MGHDAQIPPPSLMNLSRHMIQSALMFAKLLLSFQHFFSLLKELKESGQLWLFGRRHFEKAN
jgi:hypothetical protein